MPAQTPKQKRLEEQKRRQARRRRNKRDERLKPRRRADPASLHELQAPGEFVLYGTDEKNFKKLSYFVGLLIVDGEIETTIEGASTLTLQMREQDGELRKLIRRGVFVPAEKRKGRRARKAKVTHGGKRLLYIGDSLGVGTAPALKALARYPIEDTVLGSMNSAWGEDKLNNQLAGRHGAVVFDMGTNDGNTPGEFIDRLTRIDKKIGSRPLIIATLNGIASGMNDDIHDFARGRAGVIVVEWRAYSQNHPGIMSDTWHPGGAGYKDRARLFYNQIPLGKGGGKTREVSRRRGDEVPDEDLAPRLADGTKMRAAGMDWELVAITKAGDSYTFTFEDFAVSQLRRLNEPKKIKRGKSTRAEFIKAITVDELSRPKLKFMCPELHDKIAAGKKGAPGSKWSDDERDERRGRGINLNRNLKFGGQKAKKSQLRLAERCLDVCDKNHAPERVMLAACMIGINETRFRNLPSSSDKRAKGVFQLAIRQARGTKLMVPEEQVKHFLFKGAAISTGAIKWARNHPQATPAEIARAVWGGKGTPLNAYTRWTKEANALLAAYGGAARRASKVRDD